jgi:GNAT superfamily N-acetyltransferase
MFAPTSGYGGPDETCWFYSGHLASFAILHDRDHDTRYESDAHVWTAAAWRGRGFASTLLREARRRFDRKHVEGPATEAGAALVSRGARPGHS